MVDERLQTPGRIGSGKDICSRNIIVRHQPARIVDAVGEQWSWSINPSQVTVRQPVEFHVTSKDVNHGFAIYDQGLRLVAQT